MGNQTKGQPFEELIEAEKMLEEKTETQGQIIRKFQGLISNEGLFSQIADFFPYPLAIFTPQHILVVTNKAFKAEAKKRFMNSEIEPLRILQHRIDDMQLAIAITGVFDGNTYFLENLKNPFPIFSGIKRQSTPQYDHFKKAVVFPVLVDDTEITHGVIVFMP